MNLTTYEPILNQFDHFFNDAFSHQPRETPLDIIDVDNTYIVSMEIPGVNKEDIDISFEKGILKVKAKKHDLYEKKDTNVIFKRRSYKDIEKSWKVSESVDITNISSEYKNGVLEITLPKKEESISKKIIVS